MKRWSVSTFSHSTTPAEIARAQTSGRPRRCGSGTCRVRIRRRVRRWDVDKVLEYPGDSLALLVVVALRLCQVQGFLVRLLGGGCTEQDDALFVERLVSDKDS